MLFHEIFRNTKPCLTNDTTRSSANKPVAIQIYSNQKLQQQQTITARLGGYCIKSRIIRSTWQPAVFAKRKNDNIRAAVVQSNPTRCCGSDETLILQPRAMTASFSLDKEIDCQCPSRSKYQPVESSLRVLITVSQRHSLERKEDHGSERFVFIVPGLPPFLFLSELGQTGRLTLEDTH